MHKTESTSTQWNSIHLNSVKLNPPQLSQLQHHSNSLGHEFQSSPSDSIQSENEQTKSVNPPYLHVHKTSNDVIGKSLQFT